MELIKTKAALFHRQGSELIVRFMYAHILLPKDEGAL